MVQEMVSEDTIGDIIMVSEDTIGDKQLWEHQIFLYLPSPLLAIVILLTKEVYFSTQLNWHPIA